MHEQSVVESVRQTLNLSLREHAMRKIASSQSFKRERSEVPFLTGANLCSLAVLVKFALRFETA